MTISYAGRFGKLLFRWKASLWKCVWKELLVFLLLYYAIAAVYRLGLRSETQRATFGKWAVEVDEATTNVIKISFLLGLYVVTVVKRWWEQFENIAWPDNLLYLTSACVRGADEQARVLRRTVARYAVLSAILAWRNVSSRVLKRFPTAKHLTDAGMMTAEEERIYQATAAPYGRWFLPIAWTQTLLVRAADDGRIEPGQCAQLVASLHSYKDKFVRLFVFDWVTIPLVYTQVCTVATYGYFGLCLIGRQSIDKKYTGDRSQHNMYIPLFTILEFLFYMGWLKVAEHLMHPFGEEDDDFELNFIIDRHLYVAFMIVDEMHDRAPTLGRDSFWDAEAILPHTHASQRIKDRKPHSHFGLTLPFQEMALYHQTSKISNP